jgi:hypothetical protein
MFGPRRDEVTGGWRKLHDEEFHNLYASPYIIPIRMIKSRKIRWAGHVARKGELRNVYTILVGKPEAKKPLRWEDNIKTDLTEIGSEGVDWINLTQDRDRGLNFGFHKRRGIY